MNNDLVKWYGEVPSSWRLIKLKYTVTRRDEKASHESTLPYVGLEDIISHRGKLKTSLNDTEDISGISNAFHSTDVLFGKLRPYLAKVYNPDFSGRCTGELLVLCPLNEQIDRVFLKYLLLSNKFIDEVNSTTYGSKMPRANWRDIGNITVPLPNKSIQKEIRSFLDQKTSEIDTLIEDKEKLIALLEEKRQAIITEAVTKGLNPNVEMKDSGVEWIGKIPEHWEMRKAKYIFKQINEKNYPEEKLLSVLKGKGLLLRSELEFKAVMAFKGLENFKLVREGDFVIHLRSFQSGFEMSSLQGIVSPAYTVFRASIELDNNYFKYVFYSQYFIDYIGSTTQSLRDGKPIAYDDFSSSYLMFPPEKEQKEISDYLASLCKEMDKAKELIQKQLLKLKEYRQTLIYEAVTGKIDVQVMLKETEQEEVSSS